MLTRLKAHELVEEKQIYGETNSQSHRYEIKANPEAFKVAILIIQELVHPLDLLDEVLISFGILCSNVICSNLVLK